MPRRATQPRTSTPRPLERVVWGLLAAVHLAPMWKTGVTLVTQDLTWSHAGAFGAVLASFGFFALSAMGLGLARLRFTKATAPVLVLSFALVHGDTTFELVKSHPETVAIAAGVEPAIALASRCRRKLPEFMTNLAGALSEALPPAPCLGRAAASAVLPARSLGRTGVGLARGPPSRPR